MRSYISIEDKVITDSVWIPGLHIGIVSEIGWGGLWDGTRGACIIAVLNRDACAPVSIRIFYLPFYARSLWISRLATKLTTTGNSAEDVCRYKIFQLHPSEYTSSFFGFLIASQGGMIAFYPSTRKMILNSRDGIKQYQNCHNKKEKRVAVPLLAPITVTWRENCWYCPFSEPDPSFT